jgi:hypothetical protein
MTTQDPIVERAMRVTRSKTPAEWRKESRRLMAESKRLERSRERYAGEEAARVRMRAEDFARWAKLADVMLTESGEEQTNG